MLFDKTMQYMHEPESDAVLNREHFLLQIILVLLTRLTNTKQ